MRAFAAACLVVAGYLGFVVAISFYATRDWPKPLTHNQVIDVGQRKCGHVAQIGAPNERTGAIDFVCADGRVVTIDPMEEANHGAAIR